MSIALPEQIPALLIPMIGRPLILPNVAVAEIVPWRRPARRDANQPKWLLGQLEWRGLQLPLISLELMHSPNLEEAQQGNRIAVLNGVGGTRLPFYALSIQGIPRLVRVYPDEISGEEAVTDKPGVQYQIAVSGERTIVPDLNHIEAELEKLNWVLE